MNIFEIDDLRCAYPGNNHTIVHIGKLQIPRGKLTVILGRSGSGKSTMIEALGLMNNTIKTGNVKYNAPSGSENLATIWHQNKKVAEIRKNHFSFIFQDDYLMPHYTNRENALIAKLIQGPIPGKLSGEILEEPLIQMNLSGNGILNRFPFQIAGGQKQRLSFIRAVMKDFDILFGDEPTGNLDYNNSIHLFEFIRTQTELKNISALIVSHNIELSVEKADMIIVLTPSPDQNDSLFALNPDHVFERDEKNPAVWKNYQDKGTLIRKIQGFL
jgi:putative ABC transport system ATP-binding protein